MNKPIKIAYIVDTIETQSAGTEKQLLMLLDKIDKKKFSPCLICLRNSEWLKTNSIPVEHYILGVNSLISLNALRGLMKFRKIIDKEKISIVQTFFTDANIFGTIAARLSGVKIVISSRRNFGGYWHTPFFTAILKLMRFLTTVYISNSELIAKFTISSEKIEADRIFTIYNGLEFEKFERITPTLRNETRNALAISDSDILVGLMANWRPVKNIPLFLKVASKFRSEFPNVKFVMIGKPPAEYELSNVLKEFDIDLNIRFLGVISDIIPILSAMDIGVLCSSSESLSNSITEYLAAGLPCVVSQAGGNEEAIGYGRGGVVFQNNSAEDFYIKLKDLISNPSQMGVYARQAKEYAHQKYDLNEMIRSHEKLYFDLITNTSSSRFK